MIKIKVEDIRKEFPNRSKDTIMEALGGVSLDIKEGQFKPADIYTNEFNPYFKK